MNYYLVSRGDITQAIEDYENSRNKSLVDFLIGNKQPVKYLDRDKVEEILYKNVDLPHDIVHTSQFFKIACEICQLAIKINEEDIIDVLKEIVKFELIAKQILERIGK